MRRALYLIGALMCFGCATQQDLDALRWEVSALQTRLNKTEGRFDEKDRLIQQSLTQQANLQAQYTELYTQLLTLQGRLDEASSGPESSFSEERIKTLEKEVQALRERLENGGPDPRQGGRSLYDGGLELFRAGNFQEAIVRFDAYLKQSPDPSLIDNVHFWIGESLYGLGRYEDAILRYDLVVKKFSQSEKMPDCLLKQGLSFLKLGDKETGNLILKRLVKEYGGSEAAGKAKKVLGTG